MRLNSINSIANLASKASSDGRDAALVVWRDFRDEWSTDMVADHLEARAWADFAEGALDVVERVYGRLSNRDMYCDVFQRSAARALGEFVGTMR